MKIQTNKYTYLIIVTVSTIVIFTVSFFLIGKIWEKKPDTNNTNNTSSTDSSNSTASSSSTSATLFSTEGIENDKYYKEVVKLGEEFKKLVLTGESDYINPNNKELLYHDSEEHFFEDFVRLEDNRVEKITKTEIVRVNIPAFCTNLADISMKYLQDIPKDLETQLEIALKGYDAPLVKKVSIDGLYIYRIYDQYDNGNSIGASELILVKSGKAKFIDKSRWVLFSNSDMYGKRDWRALVLKCDID